MLTSQLIAITMLFLCASSIASGQVRLRTQITHYTPPRPAFVGLHVGLSEDSAFTVMKRLAARYDTLHADSVLLMESDSVQVWGLAAYVQLQVVRHSVRTVVINWHPLEGEKYTNLRDGINALLERNFGRGVAFVNGSLTYHRWETEDGTMEASHSDKYLRIFLRLGKPRE